MKLDLNGNAYKAKLHCKNNKTGELQKKINLVELLEVVVKVHIVKKYLYCVCMCMCECQYWLFINNKSLVKNKHKAKP